MIKLTVAKCPSCGADIEVNENLKKTICQYCGTTVLIEDAIEKKKVELSGKVEIDGVATKKSKLKSARQFLNDQKYDNASEIYREILKIDPENYEAWWGRFICENEFAKYYGFQDKYGNKTPETAAKIKSENINSYAYKAIKYCKDEELKKWYKEQIEEDEKYIEDVLYTQRISVLIYKKEKKKGLFAKLSGNKSEELLIDEKDTKEQVWKVYMKDEDLLIDIEYKGKGPFVMRLYNEFLSPIQEIITIKEEKIIEKKEKLKFEGLHKDRKYYIYMRSEDGKWDCQWKGTYKITT